MITNLLHSTAATPQLCNKAQLAARLNVHKRTVDNLVARGAIPCIRLGVKLLRFDPDDVLAALKQGGAK